MRDVRSVLRTLIETARDTYQARVEILPADKGEKVSGSVTRTLGQPVITLWLPDFDDPIACWCIIHEMAHIELRHLTWSTAPTIYAEFQAEKWTREYADKFLPGFFSEQFVEEVRGRLLSHVVAWDEADLMAHPITFEMADYCGYDAPNGFYCVTCGTRHAREDMTQDQTCHDCH